MKTIAKWVAIIWSIICLIGICCGIITVSESFSDLTNEYEFAGGAIGLGCGLGIWLVIWFVIAGPATLIYFLSGKTEATQVAVIQHPEQVQLCTECGKYYGGQPKFCPNCGKPIDRE
jgi:hypothetical protein